MNKYDPEIKYQTILLCLDNSGLLINGREQISNLKLNVNTVEDNISRFVLKFKTYYFVFDVVMKSYLIPIVVILTGS